MNLRAVLENRLADALGKAGMGDSPAMVRPSARPRFGDYQANGCMAAGKRAGINPRDLAEKVITAAELDDLAEKLEVAGPGFINITLKTDWLGEQLTARLDDEKLGVEPPADPQTVVVDYSSPNLAKEMHVGHLRSTIIGDALARTLDFLGHNVIRQNHVGDWGTQFGMLTAYLDYLRLNAARESEGAITEVVRLEDLEEFYREAKRRFDEHPKFAEIARGYVVKLQAGDEKTLNSWRRFRKLSLNHCAEVYKKLGVTLRGPDVRGESSYNDDLPQVVEDLQTAGLLEESQGAQCVFLDEFRGKGPDDTDLPVIIRKSDGGYLYATTDLAGMRYRSGTLGANRVLYVTDSRQGTHFAQVFGVARQARFVSPDVSLEHVPFGMMLGADRRPFMTREGGTIKLVDLLGEAEVRARAVVQDKNPDLSDDGKDAIAAAVGIGAVKYADLAQNRNSDYVFSWDKMLSLDGNTAPYMQYAYVRVCGIFRRGDVEMAEVAGRIDLAEPAERVLGVKLAQLPEIVQAVADECLPNILCAYLYDVAGAFMTFFEACPVLKADEPIRTSRLALCRLTALTIKTGLDLLGIETIEQM